MAAKVWQRIALAESNSNQANTGWRSWESWFNRPVFAIGFVAACMLLGLFLAEIRVSHVQRERSAQLARSYLKLIDPLVTAAEQERRS
jgi:hypothetical protein